MSSGITIPAPVGIVKPGYYSDGHPLDEVHYLESKLILKPEPFNSVKAFLDYGALVRRQAEALDVELGNRAVVSRPPDLREVQFYDTPDFRLYNNAFILRRRTRYQAGFPTGDPEIVFKFRHPDVQKAAETDVRPKIARPYQIKFKAEMLPLRDRIGGHRILFSHNAQFGLRSGAIGGVASVGLLAETFPALQALKKAPEERVELVNHMVVEELLQELGRLDFGKGVEADCNVALWRGRAEHNPLVAEFAFQCKFKRSDELHDKAMHRVHDFFVALQESGRDWVALGTTKTAVVYRLNGNPPQNHE
jgi:hypothetical protein